MRVLHVTPRKLPDIRVERAILSDLSRGHEVHVAAPGLDGFDLPARVHGFHEIRFRLLDKAGFRVSRRRLRGIVERVKPDIIHAHDFPAAYLAKGLAPMVYDSHEDRATTAYTRARVKLGSLFGRLARLLDFVAREYARRNVSVLEGAIVVAPSRKIVENYLRLGAADGFVLPNFPHRLELSAAKIEPRDDRLHGALDRPKYLVYGPRFPRRVPVEGFPERFATGKYGTLLFAGGKLDVPGVISLGFVPHMRLYELFSGVRTILVPRRPHERHEGISPNRVYVLSRVGAVPIVPKTMRQVLEYIPESLAFGDDEEFRELVRFAYEAEERMELKLKVLARPIVRDDEAQEKAYKRALKKFEPPRALGRLRDKPWRKSRIERIRRGPS